MDVDELARRIAESTDDADRQRVRIELYHSHLPKLEAAGVVERRDGRVAPADHPVYEASWWDVPERADATLDGMSALAHRRRRTVLSVLAQGAADSVSDLAVRVAAAETGSSVPVDGQTIERVRTSLHHVHLPKLDAVGLLEYDPGADRVRLADDLPAPAATALGQRDGPRPEQFLTDAETPEDGR